MYNGLTLLGADNFATHHRVQPSRRVVEATFHSALLWEMALLEAAACFFCLIGFIFALLWMLMMPPNVQKKKVISEKLDVVKNRFTTSKIPNDIDVIVVGSGKLRAVLSLMSWRRFQALQDGFCT